LVTPAPELRLSQKAIQKYKKISRFDREIE
jgi:hypothetical protein